MRYSLNVTYDCNWHCSYCIIETHKQPKRTLSDVLKNLKSIPRGAGVSLSGGEPGLMNEEDVRLILWNLDGKDCPVDLLTNGLFLKRYGHIKPIMEKIGTIHYHCVENLTDNIEFPDLDQNFVDYQIIINNENHNHLETFLDKYSHIQFSIVPSKNIEVLNKKKAFNIIKNHKHRMTDRSISEFFECACESVTYLD